MVYIPFPRIDLNTHPDLLTWRAKTSYKSGDWGDLKVAFLPDQARLINGIHAVPKCWFSELPQGDNFAQDVEHFRPKADARPIDNKKGSWRKNTIEKKIGFPIYQDNSIGAYPWLEFDYRNYRFVTARTNRGGGKHIYFPIALNSSRLTASQYPWSTPEYSFLLDPTDPHDAAQLWVLPDGKIIPKAPKPAPVLAADYANLSTTWRQDKFNYIRAWVTIYLYKLEARVLIEGRKEVYNNILKNMDHLVKYGIIKNNNEFIQDYINLIYQAMLPSAPFALAARCALATYIPPSNLQPELVAIVHNIINNLQHKITIINQTPINWTNP